MTDTLAHGGSDTVNRMFTKTTGGAMRHDWIIDVLKDLRAYAKKHNLPLTAEGADVLLQVVRSELSTGPVDDGDDDADGHGGTPPRGLPH